MAILKKEFGVMPSGEKVYEYTLTNKKGISASFIDLGAVWTKMLVPDSDGNMTDVILGYDDLESYQINKPHFRCTSWQKCKPHWKCSYYY